MSKQSKPPIEERKRRQVSQAIIAWYNQGAEKFRQRELKPNKEQPDRRVA